MIFHTESGSVYEIDWQVQNIRQLEGSARSGLTPSGKQARPPMGEWKKFRDCTEPRVGRPMLIIWDPDYLTATETSPVVRIEE